MTNLTINNKAHTIEMTKKFEKAASRFGSDEYKVLRRPARTIPLTRSLSRPAPPRARRASRALTYDYMEKYIKAHDDEAKTIMAEFEMLRGTSAEAKEALAEACSYQEIKAWFFGKFPAIKTFHEKRTKMLEEAEVEASPAA